MTAVVLMTTQLCTRVKVVGQALLHQQFEKKKFMSLDDYIVCYEQENTKKLRYICNQGYVSIFGSKKK